MRFIYTSLFYLFIPIILLYLLWRSIKAPAYRQRWHERFGFSAKHLLKRNYIWIHAVSMGEVQAAIPLIKELKHRFQAPILVTTMTPTGSKRVHEVFNHEVDHVYLPYDLPDALARFLNNIQPKLLIIMETELWPNLLHSCQQRDIPVILANARLSANSVTSYLRIKKSVRKMLQSVIIVAQTNLDAEGFIKLGISSKQVRVTGSLKFDTDLPNNFSAQTDKLRQKWQNRPVWIAASTHDGEEKIILTVFKQLKVDCQNLLLLLVPRHPERFNQVAQLCQKQAFKIARRSQNQNIEAEIDIYLGDTMGELPMLYAACDIAFVGGTLVPVGGHNLLEPAAVGLPVIMGPQVFECAEICRQLLLANAGIQVNDAIELLHAVKNYLDNIDYRQQIGQNGRIFVQKNQGSLIRLLKIIDETIKTD